MGVSTQGYSVVGVSTDRAGGTRARKLKDSIPPTGMTADDVLLVDMVLFS